MRTRRSNRVKSYAVEKYDFDSSGGEGDEEEVGDEGEKKGPGKRRKNDDERDENFKDAAAEESPDAEELALEQDSGDSDASHSVPGPEKNDRFSRQRLKPIKPFNVRAGGPGATEYLNLEPWTADTQAMRPYVGPLDRGIRTKALVREWYGSKQQIEVTQKMLDRWMGFTVLPPKMKDDVFGLADKGLRRPGFYDNEKALSELWTGRVQEACPGAFTSTALPREEVALYEPRRSALPVLLGPPEPQKTIDFMPGDAYTLSHSGLPYDKDEDQTNAAAGWMFDCGGIVVGMEWATHHCDMQVLALAIVPHRDQEVYDYETESSKPDFEKYGIVQLWGFRGGDSVEGYYRPSAERPRLLKTLCFDHGRARRVKWNPACQYLAVLCGDGVVYVVQAECNGDESGNYEKVDQPIATLDLPDEYGVKATAMTWVTFNRLVVGYSDGSIALWSIFPHRVLLRQPVHHNDVVNIASGYPTHPYIVASTPIGGRTKIIDLKAPSYERTEAAPLAVTTQSNLLTYSDHLLGFFALYPSAKTFSTVVGFMQLSQFPHIRRAFTGDSSPTCLAVGRTHPFLLIGSTDGSLFAINPQATIFAKRGEVSDRIRLFHHEHVTAERVPEGLRVSERGASRILQGFRLEKNQMPSAFTRPGAKKGKKGKSNAGGVDEDEDEEDGGGQADPTRAVIHEPLTRITAVEWNPNDGYGCWAAAAMGSGLVRVMDLGIESTSGGGD